MRRLTLAVIFGSALVSTTGSAQSRSPPLDVFHRSASADAKVSRPALEALAASWRDGYTSMIIDLARLMRPARGLGPNIGGDDAGLGTLDGPDADTGGGAASARERDFGAGLAPRVTPESMARQRLIDFLQRQTGKRFDQDLNGWREWMWRLPYDPHPDYAPFKGAVYARIDPRMSRFFPPGVRSLIRLDEVDWGGVTVNGIPPLRFPAVLPAREAKYLRDSHVVFGVVVNGEARAYPRRILAWHEMALDRIGGIEMTVVYCTLCGTVIPYESRVGGQLRRFGTSGLLYRSNKLMFDEETWSLWSTLEGKPVIGSLAGSGLTLLPHPVVTTTWGEGRAEHPDTTVLSLGTGFKRDYSEGAAYRDYFSSDTLYFRVSRTDLRLKNKADVLTLHVRPAAGGDRVPVAIVGDFLGRNPVYHFEVQGRRLLVVTSPAGANRVFDLSGRDVLFQNRPTNGQALTDEQGRAWTIGESALTLTTDPAFSIPRVVAARAFWFGWFAQFPDTVLIGAAR